MAKNNNLHAAKVAKCDEFYTQYTDIQKELCNYPKSAFEGKVVYCNCDDARESQFFRYFSNNFELLGLKRLITTSYNPEGKGSVLVYDGDKNGNRQVDDSEITIKQLEGNGDFRSEECIEFLKQADIVVTNPPFSLFREYVKQLMDFGKKFIIIGNMNAITYKEIFPYIKDNKMWWGCSLNGTKCSFVVPKDYEGKNVYEENGVRYGKVNNAIWFTNVEHSKRNKPLDLVLTYTPDYYPKYDNYDAIEVSKTAEIPCDYDGVMGVPITFLYKYCPSQFEIVDARIYGKTEKQRRKGTMLIKDADSAINGKATYARIAIKPLDLVLTYTPDYYPKYDNYDAIEVSKVSEIPCDYDGVMGVPITFLYKYCPSQFEIVGLMSGAKGESLTNGNDGRVKFYVDGRGVYARILIKRKASCG